MLHTCRLCGSDILKEVRYIKSPWKIYSELQYMLYQCDTCGSRLFDCNEHPVKLDEFYDNRGKEEHYIKARFCVSKYWLNEIRNIKRYLGKEPLSVLDIGCRTGDYLMHWPENIERVGVELSKESAAVAESRGLNIINDFVENVTFKKKFDVVTCYAILEHLSEPLAFLNKINLLVNYGGLLVVMVPSYECIKVKILDNLNVRWHMYSPPEHLNYYSRKFLDGYFCNNGFTLEKRIFTSGGMFNPFRSIPLIGRIVGRLMWYLDTYSIIHNFACFDHIYSYYKKQ